MNESTVPSASELQKLWEMIKDIRFGMLVTRHGNGHLHARPMTTQNRSLDEPALWFFASRSTDPAAESASEPQVNVSYAAPDKDRYVSVTGSVRLVEDLEKKKALWSTPAQAWFPGGPEDPDVALLEVRIEHAEYWDVKDSKPVQLLRMATAAMSGRQPRMDADYGQVGGGAERPPGG
ncbi:pyridoxamine 5'-phosphate oxidase family protein [Caldimonas tepidiphila]|uniref:pyridoxamine 5'-phosphate oxidase family protein n=1 Tax=Caldimonas tepidiphila TaxID=2315841 RepID=UPI000E5B51A2|nr:pyridoxamine 5'-phosphate oxidase family protein [Caldimonas tepidiphila]